jgi:hypothetical protein
MELGEDIPPGPIGNLYLKRGREEGQQKGRDEGREEGRVAGLAAALRALMESSNVQLTPDQDRLIETCSDPVVLKQGS